MERKPSSAEPKKKIDDDTIEVVDHDDIAIDQDHRLVIDQGLDHTRLEDHLAISQLMEISQDHHLAIDQDHHLVTSQGHLAISQAQDHMLLETMEKVDQEMDLQTRSHDSKQQGQDQVGRIM